jgi:hypothetical protein
MAFLDRCIWTPAASGLADWAVVAPVQGYLTPALAGAVDGVLYGYAAELIDRSQWQVGYGTWVAARNTLVRSVVKYSSSANNSEVNFSAPPIIRMTALAEDMGLIKVAGSTLVASVSSFDVPLPSGYFMFELRFSGLAFAQPQQLFACAWSANGGSTFLNDIVHRDSYMNYVPVALPSLLLPSFPDAVISVAPPLTSGNFGSGTIMIDPGEATGYPCLRGVSVDNAGSFWNWFATVNRSAKVAPVPGRINLLRFLPYGIKAQVNPPNGDALTKGSWTLLGVV